MTGDLMNAKEVFERLGISKSLFNQRRRLGMYRFLEAKRPMGQKRYSRALVEAYVNGEPVSHYGRRSA